MRTSVLLIGFIITCCLSSVVFARDTLVFAMSSSPPFHNEQGTGFLDLVEREALNRAGYNVKFDTLPGERALLYANQGISDGEGDRIEGMEQHYTNLIRIDEPTVTWNFVAFSYRPDIKIDGWESIQSYSVELINGWKILEYNTENAAIQTKVKDIDTLFTLLTNKRADLVLIEAWQGLYYLNQHNIQHIKLLHPPIAVKEKYMYLHKKHEKLAPKIAAALRDMKADSSYQKIVDQVLTPLTQK